MFAAKDLQLTRPSGGAFTTIPRSLRFRSSASAYLNRTFGAPTNANIFTLSMWVKRGKLTTEQSLFDATTAAQDNFEFSATDTLQIVMGGVTVLQTTALYRDPSAWYHIVWQANAGTSTIYVNNVSAASGAVTVARVNTAVANYIGSVRGVATFFDGYFAEVNFIDGQALTPTSFGAVSATTGVWAPIKYTGTYGTNGFHLDFNSYGSTAALGTDTSGNGNTWTVNNCSVTAGVTYDSMIDVPTVSATGSNYSTLNPLVAYAFPNSTLEAGNLNHVLSGSPFAQNRIVGTMTMTGKTYVEMVQQAGANTFLGVAPDTLDPTNTNPYQSPMVGIRTSNGNKCSTNLIGVAYGSAFAANDVVMMAVDPVNQKIWWGKNGTWFASGDPAAGTNPALTGITTIPRVWSEIGTTDTVNWNFGQRAFTYTPPTGYSALNTNNLPTPSILIGAAHMAATTYTGTGASLTVANTVNSSSFQPDFVWIKSRSAATNHNLFDSVRTATKWLHSNSTAAEATDANSLTAFGSTGFTLGSDVSSLGVNVNAATYVGWQWKGSGTTVSNTTGSITSTVCVNPTAGFSIVTWTGTGANGTVGHSLGVAPSMLISKQRTTPSSLYNWQVYHSSLPSNLYALALNDIAAQYGPDATLWNSTSPSSTVFSVGTSSAVNLSTGTYVTYCFAPIAGYSAFGSYTGNSSTDGTFVFTGFRPRFFMWKNVTTTATGWVILDSTRDTYNVVQNYLQPNTAGAEGASPLVDFLSNGIKFRASSTDTNATGNTYIYAAFAESPFKNSLAR